MISNLSISEFFKRLVKLTKIGNTEMKGVPFIWFTIFAQANKRFYGEYDKSKFRLADNDFMSPITLDYPSSHVIEGSYKSKNGETKVSYTMRPILTTYLINRFFPFIFLFIINIEYIMEWNIKGLRSLWFVDLLVLLLLPFLIFLEKSGKKRFENDFRRIFEIKDE